MVVASKLEGVSAGNRTAEPKGSEAVSSQSRRRDCSQVQDTAAAVRCLSNNDQESPRQQLQQLGERSSLLCDDGSRKGGGFHRGSATVPSRHRYSVVGDTYSQTTEWKAKGSLIFLKILIALIKTKRIPYTLIASWEPLPTINVSIWGPKKFAFCSILVNNYILFINP